MALRGSTSSMPWTCCSFFTMGFDGAIGSVEARSKITDGDILMVSMDVVILGVNREAKFLTLKE